MSINLKPLFEADGYKPIDRKRPVPTHNTQHPKNLVVKHDGRGLGGHLIVSQIKAGRRSVCGLKDKMALAGSSAKRAKFVSANVHTDRMMDAPTENLIVPAPVRAVKRSRASHRMVDRMI